MALPGINAIIFQQLDGPAGREMTTFLIGGTELESSDQLTVEFHVTLR